MYSYLRITLTIVLLVLVFPINKSMANNVTITDVALDAQNKLSFNIYWENSWYTPHAPNNWDAVWVFIKAQDCESYSKEWNLVLVNSTGHTAAAPLRVDAASGKMGVFVRRSSYGFGTVDTTQ